MLLPIQGFKSKDYKYKSHNISNDLSSPRNSLKEKIKSEKRLVKLLEKAFLENEGHQFIKEFDCSNGVADLIIFKLRKDWIKNSSMGEIPSRWIYALRKLPYRKIFSINFFSQFTGISIGRAKCILKVYEEAGYCKRKKGRDTWIKHKQPRPISNQIFAIEAKLKNWQRALSQAYRYLEYADQSWVILDEKHIEPALKNIEKFTRLNIGLASINNKGAVFCHLVPIKQSPRSELSFWQANSEIAKHFNLSNICRKNY